MTTLSDGMLHVNTFGIYKFKINIYIFKSPRLRDNGALLIPWHYSASNFPWRVRPLVFAPKTSWAPCASSGGRE